MSKYSFIVDIITEQCRGICKRGTLDAIRAKEQGNLLDECREQDTCSKARQQGWAWYLTPSASSWRFIVLDERGAIKDVRKDEQC